MHLPLTGVEVFDPDEDDMLLLNVSCSHCKLIWGKLGGLHKLSQNIYSGQKANINDAIGDLLYEAVNNYVGDDAIHIFVSDVKGLTDTHTITVHLHPVNDPPKIHLPDKCLLDASKRLVLTEDVAGQVSDIFLTDVDDNATVDAITLTIAAKIWYIGSFPWKQFKCRSNIRQQSISNHLIRCCHLKMTASDTMYLFYKA